MHPLLRAGARTLVRTANTPVAKARTTRALRDMPRPIKLEIGGTAPRPGWFVTNVNAVARHYLDATGRWPLEDGAVSVVYADNVIEHITLGMARDMLAEAYRCLRPGGVIRLVTPDIRGAVELYLAGESALRSPVSRHYQGLGLVVEHPIDVLRIPIGSFGHHTGYVYDLETLTAELTAAGFRDVQRCALGQSAHADLQGLDQRAESGDGQIAVEAVR